MSQRIESQLDDDVEVTNLIDLMVVLCAMLMLLLPTATVLRELRSLPPGQSAAKTATSADLAKAPVVRFNADGDVFWNEASMTLEQVSEQTPPADNCVVYVAGDQATPYGVSVAVRSRLQSAGWEIRELMQPQEHKP